MARLGFFGRIGKAIGRTADRIANVFTPKPEPRRATPRPSPRPAPSPSTPPSPRGTRDRQRARERDPYLRIWNQLSRRRGYLEHRDLMDEVLSGLNVDEDTKLEYWEAYIRYMVNIEGGTRLNDIRNPFWQITHMHPDDFNWYEWREAMGYEHGARK